MNCTEYLENLENKLVHNFNIIKEVNLYDQFLDIFATLEVQNEKYFISRNLKLWRAENYEYVFIKSFNNLTFETFQQFITYLQKAITYFVKPHPEHMESLVTGVLIVGEEPESQLQSQIKSFRYRKNFKFSLQGWSEIRLILVIPSSNKVIANKRGKEVERFYTPVFKQTNWDRGLKKLRRIVTFKM